MHTRDVVALLAATLLLVCPAGAGSNEAISIAVIADKAFDLDQSHLVSILEVELSQSEGIQVLERARIDEILREQQLSLAGLLDRDAIVKAGQLLRADAFVLLSQESTNIETKPSRSQPVDELDETLPQSDDSPKEQLIRVRVAETAHGLRLLDKFEELESSKIEETTDRIIRDIHAVVGKLNLPAGQAIPIGIVDIHRVQLGERHKLLERALPVLLSVRLSKEPRIIMLEREDLKILLDEKLLTEGQDTEFWGSAILIDGYLQPKEGTIEMTLHLRKAAGQEITTFTVPVEPNQPSLAIDKAANEILKQLQNSPPSIQWKPELEAQEFYKQGAMLLAHHRYEDAVTPLETAHALIPKSLLYTSILFENQWTSRYYEPGGMSSQNAVSYRYSDLELVELVSILVRQIQRDYERNDVMDARFLYDKWCRFLGVRPNPDCYFASLTSVSSEQIKVINRENRRIWYEIMSKALKERSPSIGYPFPATIAGLVWIGYDDPDELFIKLKEIYKEIIFPPSMGGVIHSNNQRYSNCHRGILAHCRNISLIKYNKSHLYGSEERILSLWYNYLKELSEIEDPIVKYYSHLAQAESMRYDREIKRSDLIKEQFKKASDIMVNEILTSDGLLRDSTMRSLCYRFKRSVKFTIGSDYGALIEIHKSIYEALTEKNNVRALSCWEPGRDTIPIDRSVLEPVSAKNYYELLEKAALILQNGSGDERRIKGALVGIRDCQLEIRLLYPQLDPKQKQSSITSTLLLKREDWPETFASSSSAMQIKRGFSAMQMKLKNNCLYVVNIPRNAPMMFSIIDIAQKKINALYQIKLIIYPQYLTGLVVGDNNSFASITGTGLIVLPGASSNGKEILSTIKILTQKDGLPSVNITGIAENNHQLWVAYGKHSEESGLGLYNPESGHWETFICSTIKDDSPLSSGQPFGRGLIQLTPVSSDKLYFLIGRTMTANMRKWVGLWKMNINTRELKYIGNCGLSESPVGYLENNGDEIWCKGGSTLIRFIPNSDEAFYVLGQYWSPFMRERKYLRPSEREVRSTWINCQNDLFIPETSLDQISFGPFDRGSLDLATSAVHGNQLWARLGKSQVAILYRDKSYDEAKIIDNDILDGEPVERFVSTPYGLVAIGNGMVGLIDTESIER